jgi:acyl-coenzyme A synthetase/AMP-(fatty) acid ligase
LVVDCAVVSGKSIFGEHIVAYVVPDKSVSDVARQLSQFVKQHLPRHKQPSECIFLDEIPYSKTGKVLKRKLRQARLDARS